MGYQLLQHTLYNPSFLGTPHPATFLAFGTAIFAINKGSFNLEKKVS